MEWSQLLEKAQRVEEVASQFYDALAHTFAREGEAAGVFTRLAEEERQHAARIGMLKSMMFRDKRSFRGLREPKVDLGELLEDARACAQQAGDARLALEEARALVMGFEERLADVHAHLLVDGVEPSVRALFEMLAQQDREHARLLKGLSFKR